MLNQIRIFFLERKLLAIQRHIDVAFREQVAQLQWAAQLKSLEIDTQIEIIELRIVERNKKHARI